MSTTMTKQEIEAKLTALAQQDDSFKQDLIKNPRFALEKAGLGHLPDNTLVKVIDNKFEEELSEEELESVSGGLSVSIKIEIS
ncbi:hypothetical protein [Nostoc sp.]